MPTRRKSAKFSQKSRRCEEARRSSPPDSNRLPQLLRKPHNDEVCQKNELLSSMATHHSLYFVYILKCADNTYYIGKTYDIEKRIKQHNGVLSGGAKYTSSRKPVKLVYFEIFTSQTSALQREWQIKQLTRKQKEALIGS